MAEYQKISDWTILKSEEDTAMVQHAKVGIDNCVWHERYIDDILLPYFLTGKRRTVIDIGSSYGWMAVSFAKHFDEVKCFEVREDIRDALKENVSRFSNVEVFDCGVSSEEKYVRVNEKRVTGVTRIAQRRFSDTGAPIIGKDEYVIEKPQHKNGILVRPLDSYNFENVDCIKLDIEDHEYYAILGAQETIKKWKPVLILEISFIRRRHLSFFKPRQRIFKLLDDLDYQIADIRGGDVIFTHKNLTHYDALDL